MPVMSKKKPASDKGRENGPAQTPLRFDDPRLMEAVDRQAVKLRRSRNMTIILLLEEILQQKGLWPPPGKPPEGS